MRFIINGPTTIHGSISVSGAKNAALPLLAGTLLVDGPVTVSRAPDIEDVRRMQEILESIGAQVTRGDGGTLTVDATSASSSDLPERLVGRLRASTILLGPLLVRFGSVVLPQPGGCAIGQRPIDLFVDGIRAFGCSVDEAPGRTRFSGTPSPTRFVFPVVSVTGTETLLLLASRTPGTSVLENVAMEPEVTQLAQWLNDCGAHIEGIGSPTLTITGVDRLRGAPVTCIPDRLETGTFAALVAACGGSLTIEDCDPTHVAVLLKLLTSMGASVDADPSTSTVRISATLPLRAVSFRTHEYPGLATDAQPPLTIAMTQATGLALVHETIYEGRLQYIDKLNKMGARIIQCDPHRCIVEGPKQLHGTKLESPDIRAGIALLIAAAVAKGTSVIENIYQIDRGFERIEERLRDIGVDITREK
jgi:UDP-N-acetylglucosamine 1-carboxyvinyltransferase